MSNKTCILSTKDFTALEVMRDQCTHEDLLAILKEKIESAVVVFGDDIPANVATLLSRVTFRVDGRDPDTRTLSQEETSPIGMFLPITTFQGLALIGLSEGQEFILTNRDVSERRITLEKVHYQPEAAKRETELMGKGAAPARRKPTLNVIQGDFKGRPRHSSNAPDGFDDPGPSAA